MIWRCGCMDLLRLEKGRSTNLQDCRGAWRRLGRRWGHRQQRQVPGFRLCPLLESSTSTQGPGKLCTHPPLLPGLGICAWSLSVGSVTSSAPQEGPKKRGFVTSKAWPPTTASESGELLFEAEGPHLQELPWRAADLRLGGDQRAGGPSTCAAHTRQTGPASACTGQGRGCQPEPGASVQGLRAGKPSINKCCAWCGLIATRLTSFR